MKIGRITLILATIGILLHHSLAFPAVSWKRILFKNARCIAAINHTIYVGVNNEGMYKTVNEGKSWRNIRVGPGPAPTVISMAIDPKDERIIYAGTSKGLFKSDDGGWSWVKIWPYRTPPITIAVDPKDSRVIYADVFKTTDGGRSWKQIFPVGWAFCDLAVNPRNTEILYATGSIVNRKVTGLYKSEDGGLTWRKIFDYPAIPIVIDSRRPMRVYVGGDGKVYRSMDGGDSWTDLREGLPQGLIYSMLIDPLNPNIIYAGVDMAGVYRSEDGGETWSPLGKGFPDTVKIMDLAIDPSSPDFLYAATISGVAFGNEYGLWRMELPPRKPFHSVSVMGELLYMWGGIKMDKGLNPLKRG